MKKLWSLALVVGLWAGVGLGAAPWHHPLYLHAGRYWPERVPVTVQNTGDREVTGAVCEVTVGAGQGEVALVGLEARTLRACDEVGGEILYEIRTASGETRHEGALQGGDRIFFPVILAPKQRRTYYLYAGNDHAGAVPDFISAGFVNGGFEAGRNEPAGWHTWGVDGTHKMSWVTEGARSGKRCARTDVAEGAAATWIKYVQDGIPVRPGQRYQFRAWVKAQGVKGAAGWFIHVNGDKPQLINRVLTPQGGTYDWQEVKLEFEVPPTGTNAAVGTVLHGTGTAWFDDASLRLLGEPIALKVTVGARETLKPAAAPPASWHTKLLGTTGQWPYRCPVRIYNFSGQAQKQVLAAADLRRFLRRLKAVLAPNSLRVIAQAPGKRPVAAEFLVADDTLLFLADLAPRSLSTYYVYGSTDAAIPRSPQYLDEADLATSAANLVRNADFEQGDGLPAVWTAAEQGETGQALCKVSRDRRAYRGKFCAKLEIPPEAPLGWAGWHQEGIPVEPNSTYLYAGYMKTKDVDGRVTLYAHLMDAEGKLCKVGGYAGARQHLSGTQDWTRVSGVIRTPPDAATIDLHLTMNAHGTVWHDSIVLCRTATGYPLELDTIPAEPLAGGYAVWEVDPIVKVFPDDRPGRRPQGIEVSAARNEYEPFQVAIKSDKPLSQVRVSVSALSGKGGAKLPEVKVERVGFVPIDSPSAYFSTDVPDGYRQMPTNRHRGDGWAGEWPDPLKPNAPFDLPAGRAQPLWFTVYIPPNAAPGLYTGRVSIAPSNAPATEIPVRVKVWKFALPQETKLQVIYDLRRGRGWDIFAGDDQWEMQKRWYDFMAARRVCPHRFEPAPKFAYENGKVTLDTADWDRTAEYCLDKLQMNVTYTPWFFYALGWAYPPKKFFGLEPFTPEYNKAFQDAYRLFMQHVRAKGWHDKFVYYISDEPDLRNETVLGNLSKIAKLAQEVDPEIPVYSSTWRPSKELEGAITLWGIGQYGCFPVEKMKERLQDGDKLWFTTDGQMATDTPYCAIERLLPYYCFKYGVIGYEFWGISWWTYDPWKFGWHSFHRQSHEGKVFRWVRYPNGDGFLTYPGEPVGVKGPVSSVRLEQAREGIEDYEYFSLLQQRIAEAKKRGHSVAEAEAALAKALALVEIPSAGGYRSTDLLSDPGQVRRVRRQIGEQINKLTP